jgi:hypothetical protein
MEITNSYISYWRSTNTGGFTTDKYGYIFNFSVSNTIFAKLFLPKPPTDGRGPPDEPPRTTVWEKTVVSNTNKIKPVLCLCLWLGRNNVTLHYFILSKPQKSPFYRIRQNKFLMFYLKTKKGPFFWDVVIFKTFWKPSFNRRRIKSKRT